MALMFTLCLDSIITSSLYTRPRYPGHPPSNTLGAPQTVNPFGEDADIEDLRLAGEVTTPLYHFNPETGAAFFNLRRADFQYRTFSFAGVFRGDGLR